MHVQSHHHPHQHLQDLVYQCVNHYVALRHATSAGLELMTEIEREKRTIPLSVEARESLVHELTERAWARVATEQPDMFESDSG